MQFAANLVRVRPLWLAELIKKALRIRRVEVKLDSGIRLSIDPASHFGGEILRTGQYESQLGRLVQAVLREGDAFIDVGANEGYFSVLAARAVGREGAVLAFEPQTRLIDVLRTNIGLNSVDNVQVIRKALGAKPSKALLYLASSINSGASSLLPEAARVRGMEEVEIVTLDSILESHGFKKRKFRLMKLDCEGFEGPVIEGASDLLASGRLDLIVLDYHQRIVGEQKTIAIDTSLRKHGYELVDFRSTWVYCTRAARKELEKDGPLKSIDPFAEKYGRKKA